MTLIKVNSEALLSRGGFETNYVISLQEIEVLDIFYSIAFILPTITGFKLLHIAEYQYRIIPPSCITKPFYTLEYLHQKVKPMKVL